MDLQSATVETLYDEVYETELRAWKDQPVDLKRFTATLGAYEWAYTADVLLFWWIFPAVGLAALFHIGGGVDLFACAFLAILLAFILANAYAKSKQSRGDYSGVGPIGRWTYRRWVADRLGPSPERLDPWSDAAIVKTVAHTRRRIREEQDAVLQRIWSAKLEAGSTLRSAQELLEKVAGLGGDPLLREARVDALRRSIDRQRTVVLDLEAYERTVLDTPTPVLARLEALEADIAQRDAIARVVAEEDRTRLLEAEATAIRASVDELVSMVRTCEASLNGISGEIQARKAAERELQQALQ